MALRERLFGAQALSPTQREQAAEQVRAEVEDSDIVEVEVRGESHCQDALGAIAGPKEEDAKQLLVGVTLRCEPDNEFDANAVRQTEQQQHGRDDPPLTISPPRRPRS